MSSELVFHYTDHEPGFSARIPDARGHRLSFDTLDLRAVIDWDGRLPIVPLDFQLKNRLVDRDFKLSFNLTTQVAGPQGIGDR